MKDKIYASVAISNRHVHLTKEVYDLLFDEDLSMRNELGQIGEFAANQTLRIEGPKGYIDNVRLIGPFRKYNQVEVSRSDARILGITPPVRMSGNLVNSETIILVTKKAKIRLENACIIAERHIHMNEEKKEELGLQDNERINLIVNNIKGGTMDARVKVTSNGFYEVHIDIDDANSFLLNKGDEVEIRK